MSTRRDAFRTAAKTGLALGLAAAGRPLLALPEMETPGAAHDDIELMNTALALEHEAIWAYGLAGGSGLLSAEVRLGSVLGSDLKTWLIAARESA